MEAEKRREEKGAGEKEGRERSRKLFKVIMAENLRKSVNDMKTHVQKGWRTTSRICNKIH